MLGYYLAQVYLSPGYANVQPFDDVSHSAEMIWGWTTFASPEALEHRF